MTEGAPDGGDRFERILVRAPNWIGDQVLAYPFFHYLRKAYPRARIAVACVPWVEALQFRNLVDEVHVLRRPSGSGLLDRAQALGQAARELRQAGGSAGWDLGISMPNSLSAAWLLRRSGARVRRGYATDGRSMLLTEKVHWPTQHVVHRAQAYLELLPGEARPGRSVSEFWGVPAESELDEDMPGEVATFDAARAWPAGTPAEEPLEPPAGDYWVLAPGSQAESRRWPLENFAALARTIGEQTGWPGVIVGGVSEALLADTLLEDPSLRLIDRTAQGPVPLLSRIFAQARFTVSNDSGLAHVASLCGSPVQLVWGAGNMQRTRPLGPGKVKIVFNPVECWPCERNACKLPPGRQLECLKGIQAEAVWKEIESGIIARNSQIASDSL